MIASFFFAAASAMTFTADRVAVDNETRAAVATGHVVAVAAPLTIRSESLSRAADGTLRFEDPTYATTCTNACGHTHWNVTGELEYKAGDHVLLRNAWLKFYEIPVFWLPYLYYPLNWDAGFSWMPGYNGRWGAFLLTRTRYRLLGGTEPGARKLDGATRFDLRFKRGLALGEDLDWNLGDFGRGDFNMYYAWDEDYDHAQRHRMYNWGSSVDRDRYSFNARHRWEVSERDAVWARATYLSDSFFRSDFMRSTLFNWQTQWLGYDNSGVFWEHVENTLAVGAEVSGRLNDFYGMTDRLPEFYLDVNPQPLFGLPVNYESESRFGYLRRNPAEYGDGNPLNAFAFNPGRWASYEAFRIDTYHRLTAPFRTAGDVLSVVPRLAYRGTYWSRTGQEDLTGGWGRADTSGAAFRSTFEGGVTFAARGTAWIDDRWRHMAEPYLDVLAQEVRFSSGSDKRPLVFDNLDASVLWEDQFAGRARNLPYSYYGVTPGFRNAWDRADERGNLRTVVDLDTYAALQFGSTSFTGGDGHRLAKVGEPNYGKHGCFVMPGARVRWRPTRETMWMACAEYDSDNNRIAAADAGVQQKLSESFSHYVKYALRDYRLWDFAASPYDARQMTEDAFNSAHLHYAEVGFENHPIDWFAWSPFVRWDIKERELDCVGSWFDYLTDCLGFRFIVEYRNDYTRIDGYERDDGWSFEFYVYLRALGSDNGTFFNSH